MTDRPQPNARIRRARGSDAPGVTRLCASLGRSDEERHVRDMLVRLSARETELVLVGEASSGAIVAWLQASDSEVLGAARRCEITGLIVDDAERRDGLGRRLVTACEEWAESRGVMQLVVRSNVLRGSSHPFYESLGYAKSKSQHVYRKTLH